MNVGDLIRVQGCGPTDTLWIDWGCNCFFCAGNSNRVGVILGPETNNQWAVMFDCGLWVFDPSETELVEVINESR